MVANISHKSSYIRLNFFPPSSLTIFTVQMAVLFMLQIAFARQHRGEMFSCITLRAKVLRVSTDVSLLSELSISLATNE